MSGGGYVFNHIESIVPSHLVPQVEIVTYRRHKNQIMDGAKAQYSV